MRVHVNVLGWLYVLSGIFGILTGLSLNVLAAGTSAALAELGSESPLARSVLWLFLVCGASLVAGGTAMVVSGRAVARRAPLGQSAVLLLAIPNLFLVPFGTALAVYTFWTLLNDDARHEFGRPPRSPLASDGSGESS